MSETCLSFSFQKASRLMLLNKFGFSNLGHCVSSVVLTKGDNLFVIYDL